MSVLTAALEYAELRMRVIPLGDRAKKPRFMSWPERATSDREIVRGWFENSPDANLGLAMGEGLAALDFDASRGGLETYRRLIEDGNLPETATAHSGGGGRHKIYRTPEPLGNRHDLQPGMDVKGCRGYIVAAPSIHPETGNPYVFERHPSHGISEAPQWLLAMLTQPDRDAGQVKAAGSSPMILGPSRLGDLEMLSGDLIRRFPVLGIGRRNDQMVRCVGSLLARGFEDRTVQDAVEVWWGHFAAIGTIGTLLAEAPKLIRQAIASVKRSPRFIVGGTIDHRAACREIEITEAQRKLIRSDVSELKELAERLPLVEDEANPEETQGGEGGEGQTHNRIGVNLIRRRLCERLCQSIEETAFVEAILVQSIHEHASERTWSMRSTHDQISQIAADRHPGVEWDHRQLEMVKSKYISRPERPATVFELLRETSKGRRGSGGKAGTPSAYQATGLRVFV
jgi:hypothetical protein